MTTSMTRQEAKQLQRLIEKKKQLQQGLCDLQTRIDKLETNCLSRWQCGNMVLSWDLCLSQSKKKCRIAVPPEAKRFSIASSASPSFSELSYCNQPLRNWQRQKLYCSRKLRSRDKPSQRQETIEKSILSLSDQ